MTKFKGFGQPEKEEKGIAKSGKPDTVPFPACDEAAPRERKRRNPMVRKQHFQIRSKKDARLLAQDMLRVGGDFYYHVPLLGGMEGNYIDIRCDRESATFTILPSIAENSDHQERGYEELVEHLWKDRKYINAEMRKTESEWLQTFPDRH